MAKLHKKNFLDILIILTIFSIDRITKLLMIYYSNSYDVKNYFLTSFINLELIWNNGIAFGMLSFQKSIYYNSMSLLIIIIIIIIFFVMIRSNGIQKYSFMMIFGGSLGNVFDRLFYKSVPDFIDIHFNNFHWFIFNVADIFITLGVLILIYSEFNKKSDI
tara:strand:- start:708 stop:1190 length:483 start_codon:yes stop_codon:yes gene_type:complete